MKRIKFIIILFALVFGAEAQEAYRLRADFSIKVKSDSSQQLTMGTVYYDAHTRKVVYMVSFPTSETWLQQDSALFFIEDGLVQDTTLLPFLPEVTIFHLALNGNLPDYGLKGTPYELTKVTKEAGLVIKTYSPPERYREELGKVLISNQDLKLHGVVFLSAEGDVLSKQFFEDYQQDQGIAFPSRVVQITDSPIQGAVYQVTTYRNVIVNEQGKDNLYNYMPRTR